jgi:hypothetical protein
MIHYTCDRCRKVIETEHEARFSVTIEIKSLGHMDAHSEESDRDHLMMIEDIIEQLDDSDIELEALGNAIRRRTYDLCHHCQEVFLQDPLFADTASQLDFSDN